MLSSFYSVTDIKVGFRFTDNFCKICRHEVAQERSERAASTTKKTHDQRLIALLELLDIVAG